MAHPGSGPSSAHRRSVIDERRLTRNVAAVGKAVTYRTLPIDVTRRTKHALLDTIGCIIRGSESDAGRIARSVTLGSSIGGESTLIGNSPRSVGPIEAAFV